MPRAGEPDPPELFRLHKFLEGTPRESRRFLSVFLSTQDSPEADPWRTRLHTRGIAWCPNPLRACEARVSGASRGLCRCLRRLLRTASTPPDKTMITSSLMSPWTPRLFPPPHWHC